MAVRWHGYVFESSDHGDEARQLAFGLDDLGVAVSVVPLPSDDARWALPRAEVARLQTLGRTPARSGPIVSVFHTGLPSAWRITGADHHVVRTSFEADRVAGHWPPAGGIPDQIWVPSARDVEAFVRAGIPRTTLRRVPAAIDVERFDRPTRPLTVRGARRFNFLSVCGRGPRQGWGGVLLAFLEEFAREDVALILHAPTRPGETGDGIRREVETLLRRHGLGRAWPRQVVLHAAPLRSAQRPALYKTADAFVLPARGEGWGRALLEAMVMERPVIAARAGGPLDSLSDDNAYLVNGASRAHLRRLMREAFEDRAGARRRGIAARETVVTAHARRRVAEQVRQELERIAAGLPPAPRRRPPAARPTVLWQGSQVWRDSFSRVNRELTGELARAGCEVVVHVPDAYPGREEEWRRPTAPRAYAVPSRPVDVHVRHIWPPNLIPPAEGRWVVMQPWEFGSLPRAWHRTFTREVDEVWVPSRYVRDEYVAAGVSAERIAVVPNGVNERYFHPGIEARDLGRPAEFRFLFVGGTLYRKGIDILLTAYRRAFDASDDVCLVIKDVGARTFYRRQNDRAYIRRLLARGRGPAMVYLEDELPESEMGGLYRACDVLVHPYRGEGFGLPILEAMACGTPAIVTNGGACLDFCDDDNSVLVPARRQYLPQAWLASLRTVGRPWIWEVDPRDLAERLRHAYEHPAEMRARGQRASAHALARWTWRQAAAVARQRIDHLRQMRR